LLKKSKPLFFLTVLQPAVPTIYACAAISAQQLRGGLFLWMPGALSDREPFSEWITKVFFPFKASFYDIIL